MNPLSLFENKSQTVWLLSYIQSSIKFRSGNEDNESAGAQQASSYYPFFHQRELSNDTSPLYQQ